MHTVKTRRTRIPPQPLSQQHSVLQTRRILFFWQGSGMMIFGLAASDADRGRRIPGAFFGSPKGCGTYVYWRPSVSYARVVNGHVAIDRVQTTEAGRQRHFLDPPSGGCVEVVRIPCQTFGCGRRLRCVLCDLCGMTDSCEPGWPSQLTKGCRNLLMSRAPSAAPTCSADGRRSRYSRATASVKSMLRV